MVPAPGFLRGGNEVTSAQGQTTAATLSSGLCARLTGKAQARLSVPPFQDSRQCRNTSSLRALDATGRDGSHLRGFRMVKLYPFSKAPEKTRRSPGSLVLCHNEDEGLSF